VLAKIKDARKIADFPDHLGTPASLLLASHEGLDLYILDAPAFYERDGGPYVDRTGYDYPDNWKRFAALSLAGSLIANGADPTWRPDILHGHDWQAGLAPVYMKYSPVGATTPSIITIHNIAFQGQFSSAVFNGLQLPPEAFAVDGIEYYGDVGYLKGGLRTAWAITTVSPTYAEEILTPQFGMGLEGLIAERAHDLIGIVNGIDDTVWDPAIDTMVPVNFNATTLKARAANKASLLARFDLNDDPGPLFSVISRLTMQKGMDLLVQAIAEIVDNGGKLAILGSGDPILEAAVTRLAAENPGRIGVIIGYDEPLSHLMQAGADAILIPSRFEPCGLTQLYGLRYGCVPVVARTGGLADTVIDANGAAVAAKVATGVQFSPVTAIGLTQALRRTFRLYEDQKTWIAMQKAGMKADVSWDVSARQYAALYQNLLAKV
jgi:starch synthase